MATNLALDDRLIEQAQQQAEHGVQLQQKWRLESRHRVPAARAAVEVRAVPPVDRPVAAEVVDGKRAPLRLLA